jgi:hypothetical protein
MLTLSQGRMQHAPAGLTSYRQFICWYPVPKPDGKTDKVPCDRYGNNIDPHEPSKWMSWDEAASSAFGVGFVFTENDPFFCIDVDGAFNMASGQWSPLACEVMATFPDALWEVSHSGTGLHVIARGAQALPPSHKTRRKGLTLEVYSRRRFIALTGFNMRGDAGHDYGPALVGFMQRQALPLEQPEVVFEEGRDPAWSGPEDDDELLAYALAQRPSTAAKAFGVQATFKHIWEMDEKVLATAYAQAGRADGLAFNYSDVEAALAAHLSYFTGRDLPRMRRLFERWSGYRREKMEARGGDLLHRALMCGLQNPRVLNRPPPPQAAHFTTPAPVPPGANFLTLMSGAAINTLILPERQYIVEDFLPTGCLLLVGKPKKGKSWMSLELAVAVASGTEFLGHQCNPGRVIYFALEDNLRRIQSRMRMVCNAKGFDVRTVMGNVLFATIESMSDGKVPNVDNGFNEILFNTLDAEPTITLAIVDTLNVIRPTKGKNEDPVMYDRRCVEPYTKALASRPGRCVLLVHHARKANSEDIADGASGTLGITAAADGAMFLTVNAEGKTELHGQGRDMERFELIVELKAPLWTVIGDADGLAGMSGIRAKILQCVARYALGVAPKDIAKDIEEPAANVRVRLGSMVAAGLISKTEYGKYVVTPKGAGLGMVPS